MRIKRLHGYTYKPVHQKVKGPVLPDWGEVLGGSDCWCGLPSGHDWPGRDKQEPHPR